jgi:5-methylcytosine-specific restriction protein B
MSDLFTWVPLYRELAAELANWESRQNELIDLLERIRSAGFVVTPLTDKGTDDARYLVKELDPFTFCGTFNRGIRDDQRLGTLAELKKHFDLSSPVPADFAGVPILNNQKSWFVAYQFQRQPEDVPRLWRVFRLALADSPLESPEFLQAFDEALQVRNTNFNLTMGLFWIRPDTFVNLDETNRRYLKLKLPSSGLNADFYRETVQSVRERGKPLVEISWEAWKKGQEPGPVVPPTEGDYWLVGANWDGSDQTERFLAENI